MAPANTHECTAEWLFLKLSTDDNIGLLLHYLQVSCGAIGRRDACKLLGVPPNSSKAEIRQAYLEKMKLYHPDVSLDDDANETAVKLNAAYEELIQVKNLKACVIAACNKPQLLVRLLWTESRMLLADVLMVAEDRSFLCTEETGRCGRGGR